MGLVGAYVDDREPKWVQSLTFGGAPTIIDHLEAGDVHILCDDGNKLCVERKELSDLLGSIHTRRIFDQVYRMKQISPYSYVVVCGALKKNRDGKVWIDGRQTQWDYAAVIGASIEIQEMGVPVIWLDDDSEFELQIVRLSERDRGTVRVQPTRPVIPLTPQEAILAALPGIGPERAGALLEYTGRVCEALTVLTDLSSPVKIPGVADGTKRRVREALGLKAGESLGELTPF